MKNFKLILFMLGVMLLLPLGVNAETYSITTKVENKGTISARLVMTLTGIVNNDNNSPHYYVYICNSTDAKPATPTSTPTTAKYAEMLGWHGVSGKDGTISISDDWYLYEGYTTAYVLKYDGGTYTLSDDAITIEKPALFDEGSGYDFAIGDSTSIFDDSSDIFVRYPNYMGTKEKIGLKVGVVDDQTIINKYINNTADAYSSLKSYAIVDSGLINLSKLSRGESFSPGITSITKGTNYYVLITVDGDDYRSLTDVYLRTGSSTGTLTNFESNGSSSTKKVSSTISNEENPNTADKNILILTIVGLLAIFIMIIGSKKIKKV